MSKKPTKRGIKMWVASDSDTWHVWNFHLYTGNVKSHTHTYYILILRKRMQSISVWPGSKCGHVSCI